MPEPTTENHPQRMQNAALVLADGSVFFGYGVGAEGMALGEICFNTSMTGYQEILTDPSYTGQIITFTFPHIGNTGVNAEDIESAKPQAAGIILRADITNPSNYRSEQHFNDWLRKHNITGICGLDTRALTQHIRKAGAQNAAIVFSTKGAPDIEAACAAVKTHPGMEGQELALRVTCGKAYAWSEGQWQQGAGSREQGAEKSSTPCSLLPAAHHVIALDFGAKYNILRCLVDVGCKVTVVPATTSAADILAYKPDGIFLSNGPGDPAATGKYALPTIRTLLAENIPIFGICLGHQLLALALGCETEKMQQGHRGANHPVYDIQTDKVEITSQNHGFMVKKASLPASVIKTHTSLFDNTNEGIRLEGKPVFSVQHHPEASPGPRDSFYLFERFVAMMEAAHA